MPIPAWVQDAIFYQIFPDRFANGDPRNDPANVQPWGAAPNRWAYQGGDLRGIIQNFDYLLDLGVNALYLNPVFHSTANHRYHTIDYFKIDPFLGDLKDFQDLIALAHKNDVRIILDAVLNHCGRGFFAFDNLLENGEHSPYKDWFHVHRFPLKAYRRGVARNYVGWWDIKDLPKFNVSNPEVRAHLFDMTRYWLEQGIDGWRLDVPNEIKEDDFWSEYCAVVKKANPDAYLVGEIWTLDDSWLGEGRFDGLMNYPLRDAILDPLCARAPFSLLPHTQAEVQRTYSPEHNLAMYNTLASHDTKRVMTKFRGSQAKMKLAYAAIFAHPGAPAIYYGEEIGMRGGLEPASRGAFPWDQSQWNHALRRWIQKLISLRVRLAPVRRGDFLSLFSDEGRQILAFRRSYQGESIVAALNYSGLSQQFTFSPSDLGLSIGETVVDHLSEKKYVVAEKGLEITLPAWGVAWLGRP